MSIINGINGWYFKPEVIEEAHRNDRMLTMDYEFGAACPLRCIYCYRTDDSRDEKDGLLSFYEWKRIVDEAAELGVKSMKLIGGGEITEEKRFMEAMEYIASKDIIVVLFTSGTLLGDENRCQNIHGISSHKMAQWMYDLGMSIFIKYDSINPLLQDKIAGKKGYGNIRDRALKLLLEFDFNKHNPTRLGLEVNVSRNNYREIMEIYSLRIKHNIYEDVVISMPCDMYFKNKDYDITLEQKRELYRKIYQFNLQHNIPYSTISPFMGGLECTQLANGLYVTNRGHVYHCPGSFDLLGDAKNESLGDIWKSFKGSKDYSKMYYCPFREHTQIIPTQLFEEISAEFITEST